MPSTIPYVNLHLWACMTLFRLGQEESGQTRNAAVHELQLMPHLPRTLMLPAMAIPHLANGLRPVFIGMLDHAWRQEVLAVDHAHHLSCARMCRRQRSALQAPKLCRSPSGSSSGQRAPHRSHARGAHGAANCQVVDEVVLGRARKRRRGSGQRSCTQHDGKQQTTGQLSSSHLGHLGL